MSGSSGSRSLSSQVQAASGVQQAGAGGIGRKELHHGHEVGLRPAVCGKGRGNASVAQELAADRWGQESRVGLLITLWRVSQHE